MGQGFTHDTSRVPNGFNGSPSRDGFLLFGTVPNSIDMREVGLQKTIDQDPPVAVQAAVFQKVDVGRNSGCQSYVLTRDVLPFGSDYRNGIALIVCFDAFEFGIQSEINSVLENVFVQQGGFFLGQYTIPKTVFPN